MAFRQTVAQQIAGWFDKRGHGPVEVKRDICASHEDGRPVEGEWYIATPRESYCYYRTRREAEDIVKEARAIARAQS